MTSNPVDEHEVDLAIDGSFPASDPPSWTLGADHHACKDFRVTASTTVMADSRAAPLPLGREQLWDALVHALERIDDELSPGLSAVRLLHRDVGELVREAVIYGETVVERVIFTPGVSVHLERRHPGGCMVSLTDVINGEPGNLSVTCVALVQEGGDGSAAARADGLADMLDVRARAIVAAARHQPHR
jgi:hypothetical protein